MSDTLLVISAVGVPPYSARGLNQTLEPIDAAENNRRSINGVLIDLSASQFRKYRSQISCTDQQPPAMAGFWPGTTVTVDCVAELGLYSPNVADPPETEDLEDLVLERTAVTGSRRREGDFVFYRPQLVMKMTGLTTSKDEYGAETNWTMKLEEV